VMDRRLRDQEYLAGRYSIADIATWPWVAVRWLHKIDIDEFPHVRRWYQVIERRPAVQRGMAVLAAQTRIGSPDARTREVFFGKTQQRQGRSG
jgi:GSH-dependent disulfide-bond oxidoreductase